MGLGRLRACFHLPRRRGSCDRPGRLLRGDAMMPTGDRIQSQLSNYAAGLAYEQLDGQTVHAAKVRVIDTFGALVGGFAGEPCHIAREVAVQMPNPDGASVIGTDLRTSPDLAAFVNGTTARYIEMND